VKGIKNEESDSPFFSVIITSYNRAILLRRALDSLLRQTEKDWEAIVINDGSTDDTCLMIQPYLKRSRNIIYIQQKSMGATMSKNQGILHAKGKFVTFLDSDDEYSPTHLETRKALLIKNNKIEFLYGGVKVIGSEYVPDRHNYQKMVHLSTCAIGGAFFIKKRVSLLLNGFTEMPLGSDGDLFERAYNMGINMLKTEIPTYIYHRETLNSITNNLSGCLNPYGMTLNYSLDNKNSMELIS
jgi:glycosyltransferase involved in cell wall biosynthesis